MKQLTHLLTKEMTPKTKKNLNEIAFIWGLAGLFTLLFLLSLGIDSVEKLLS